MVYGEEKMKTEKVNFKNSKGLNLVGIIHLPKKGAKSIVIISHGFTAKKDRPRLINASEFFSKKGYAVLRFDALGSGESDNSPVTIENYVGGLKSAIKYVRGLGYTNLGLLGESLGGLSSILAYDLKIQSMVLWAPLTTSKSPPLSKSKKVQEDLENKGYTLYEKEDKIFKLPKQYFEERVSVNQEKILSKIKCPVLIIQGTEDKTIPLEQTKKAIQLLPEKSKLEMILGAGHNLEENIDEVINLSLNWFKRYLK